MSLPATLLCWTCCGEYWWLVVFDFLIGYYFFLKISTFFGFFSWKICRKRPACKFCIVSFAPSIVSDSDKSLGYQPTALLMWDMNWVSYCALKQGGNYATNKGVFHTPDMNLGFLATVLWMNKLTCYGLLDLQGLFFRHFKVSENKPEIYTYTSFLLTVWYEVPSISSKRNAPLSIAMKPRVLT